jgi:hypothetical protein
MHSSESHPTWSSCGLTTGTSDLAQYALFVHSPVGRRNPQFCQAAEASPDMFANRIDRSISFFCLESYK